jgi:propanol-preferring alcohol dehydrogenase
VIEGELPARKSPVIPGHQVVGIVEECGEGARRFAKGARVGIAWLHKTDGTCEYCKRGEENLCDAPEFTGYTVNGGYAEATVAPESFVYPIPEGFPDEQAAPLLCAGIIGYRALRRAQVPPGGTLGIWGFGGSAHLAAQIAMGQGAEVHVFTRAPAARELALSLGAASAQDSFDRTPVPLDSAIIFAPVGDVVPAALAALDRGGTCAIAGIYLTDIPPLNYSKHLFQERALCSVAANTRGDAAEFLTLAQRLAISVTTTPYPFEQAGRALADLAGDRIHGAGVLIL